MAENFEQAWILLGVGMLTVFSVLLLVVLTGNTIIAFVNRFFPDTKLAATDKVLQGETNSSKFVAVIAAVKQVTGGRGNVIKINKK